MSFSKRAAAAKLVQTHVEHMGLYGCVGWLVGALPAVPSCRPTSNTWVYMAALGCWLVCCLRRGLGDMSAEGSGET